MHFWIGASKASQNDQWVWLDGCPTRMGTPFWGDNADQIQQPYGDGNCAYLKRTDHYFFHNRQCVEAVVDFGVICEYTGLAGVTSVSSGPSA